MQSKKETTYSFPTIDGITEAMKRVEKACLSLAKQYEEFITYCETKWRA